MAKNENTFEQAAIPSGTICKCGAVYRIYEDDGEPGCRAIEIFNCKYCGAELARHFGECEGRLVDDSKVCDSLKNARQEYDRAVESYVQKNGYNWGTDEYHKILEKWHQTVSEITK